MDFTLNHPQHSVPVPDRQAALPKVAGHSAITGSGRKRDRYLSRGGVLPDPAGQVILCREDLGLPALPRGCPRYGDPQANPLMQRHLVRLLRPRGRLERDLVETLAYNYKNLLGTQEDIAAIEVQPFRAGLRPYVQVLELLWLRDLARDFAECLHGRRPLQCAPADAQALQQHVAGVAASVIRRRKVDREQPSAEGAMVEHRLGVLGGEPFMDTAAANLIASETWRACPVPTLAALRKGCRRHAWAKAWTAPVFLGHFPLDRRQARSLAGLLLCVADRLDQQAWRALTRDHGRLPSGFDWSRCPHCQAKYGRKALWRALRWDETCRMLFIVATVRALNRARAARWEAAGR